MPIHILTKRKKYFFLNLPVRIASKRGSGPKKKEERISMTLYAIKKIFLVQGSLELTKKRS